MQMIIMGHHFSKNGIEMGWFIVIQVRYYSDRVFFFFFFFFFFAVGLHRYRDGQHSEVYFEHPRTNIF